jgi:hypothetical protein
MVGRQARDKAASRLAPKGDDGPFDFHLAMNGRTILSDRAAVSSEGINRDMSRVVAEGEAVPTNDPLHIGFRRCSGIDNHGALTICLHAGGNLASVKTGLGLLGGGCSVDSLNQKSSSLPQPSLGSGGAGGLHSALSAGQASWT